MAIRAKIIPDEVCEDCTLRYVSGVDQVGPVYRGEMRGRETCRYDDGHACLCTRMKIEHSCARNCRSTE